MYACNGILFNHESPRRGETFVTRKITRGLANIYEGLDDCLYLGNLDAKRDWGHAKDYVEMQWLMLQQGNPEDYVIATGKQYSVRDFIECAVEELGLAIKWRGKGLGEEGVLESVPKNCKKKVGDVIIRIDARYFRPAEVETLLGDASKAKKQLGWSPKITFKELVCEMVRIDLEHARRDTLLINTGFDVVTTQE